MLKMTSEQKALFYLLRIYLGKDAYLSNKAFISWNEVFKEAEQQAVFLIAKDASKHLSLPKQLSAEINQKYFSFITANMQSMHAVIEMDRIMRSSGFQYIILKGLSAASFYPVYMHRALGDVDFLIDRTYQNEVENALTAEGYKMKNPDHQFHVAFTRPGQILEMHFDIPGVPLGIQGDLVHEYMKGALEEFKVFHIKEGSFSIPLKKYHGLILLLHMQNHMLSSGIGLRHLMDWGCFVDQTVGDSFWDTDLLPLLKKIGLYRYAQVMTKTSAMYLKTALPEWCKGVEDEICDDVMEDILTGGNFGNKNEIRSVSTVMILSYKSKEIGNGVIKNLYINLHSRVKSAHPDVEKCKILSLYYEMVYVIGWIYRLIIGQRVSLLKRVKYVKERKSVYERLEIFKVEK